MTLKKTYIFNFTGALLEQDLQKLSGAEPVMMDDVRGTAFYCDPQAEEVMAQRVGDLPVESVNFIDSGDYHYMTAILSGRIRENFSLLLFDNHPDMQQPAFGDILSCGGWVRTALAGNPFLRKVVIVGIDPGLIGETSGFGGRLAVFTWNNLDDNDLADRIDAFLPEGNIYVSVDKDVFSREFARTDWDQGKMTPDLLSAVTGKVMEGRRILGADICGELPCAKGASEEDMKMNSLINMRLRSLFMSL